LLSNDKKRLSTKFSAFIIKEVISDVYFLHNKKPTIIHRDIKPKNVLLSEGLVSKLIDFDGTIIFKMMKKKPQYVVLPFNWLQKFY